MQKKHKQLFPIIDLIELHLDTKFIKKILMSTPQLKILMFLLSLIILMHFQEKFISGQQKLKK